LASSTAGGIVAVLALWPMAAAWGVGGSAADAFLLGPSVAVSVFVWAMRPPIVKPVRTALRLFVPLLALSVGLGHLIQSPLELAGSCVLIGAAGASLAYAVEGPLLMRILRLMRPAGGRVGEGGSSTVAVPGSIGGS
jgi:hypothetical protein